MTNSRQKGKRGELEVAHILKDWGFDGKRGQQYHGGADSPDVTGLPGFHIEVKRVERLDLGAAMEQAKRDAGTEEIPVVFHRKNGGDWFVTISAEDFMPLAADYINGKGVTEWQNAECSPKP